jgi:hypothetical protein
MTPPRLHLGKNTGGLGQSPPVVAMKLSVWTYEGPPHVGAMRVATAMKGCTTCCTRRRATPMPTCCSP